MNRLPTSENPLRIGTRASPLAMAQAHMTVAALMTAHGIAAEALEIVPMTATGDRIQDRALAEIGGKELWTRELDAALDAGVIDIAVHSLKDVETLRDPRFALGAMLERADPRDRLVVRDGLAAAAIADLPHGARLGTSSPRRAAQVKRIRPDIEAVLLRGNVATRLAKLAAGEADATLLAAAGLDRLEMYDVGAVQDAAVLLPAASQGAIGIECRSDDGTMLALLTAIDHPPTHLAVAAERAFLAALGGDCRSPVAAHARWLADGTLRLDAEIFSDDGAEHAAGHIMARRRGRPRHAGAPAARRSPRHGAAALRGMTGGRPLIVTRPEPGNQATIARARALGLDAHAMPLFAAHPRAWTAPAGEDFDALLLTSAQAGPLAGPDLARLTLLPVGCLSARRCGAGGGIDRCADRKRRRSAPS